MPAYEKYGISEELVERVKAKLKEPAAKERVKTALGHVTKADLQDRAKVRRLIGLGSKAVGETLSERQTETLIRFVLEQRIDPKNPLHLIKLWNLFR
ncbi:stage VI sporulation protein F [Paenibacillus sp.]|uniref:stage VI sporulation protein F n=1 Tax=Paenibacillus sp. TaxID=58172 RepID=UPI002D315F9B|nr:stage VI sporulation protein F [Paenibacillus sp.]HZG58391.1 stage VI sporulation protein F [Paenibacillus sp.]